MSPFRRWSGRHIEALLPRAWLQKGRKAGAPQHKAAALPENEINPASSSRHASYGQGSDGIPYARVEVKLGCVGSVTDVSRSHPSFSRMMCWMATALALASKSGMA